MLQMIKAQAGPHTSDAVPPEGRHLTSPTGDPRRPDKRSLLEGRQVAAAVLDKGPHALLMAMRCVEQPLAAEKDDQGTQNA